MQPIEKSIIGIVCTSIRFEFRKKELIKKFIKKTYKKIIKNLQKNYKNYRFDFVLSYNV